MNDDSISAEAIVAVLRRADWIASPGGMENDWRIHISYPGEGQCTACGKTIMEAAERAAKWRGWPRIPSAPNDTDRLEFIFKTFARGLPPEKLSDWEVEIGGTRLPSDSKMDFRAALDRAMEATR